jgi:hypothetical protein
MERRVKYRKLGEEAISELNVFAEYDLLEQRIVWKKWTFPQYKKNIYVLATCLFVFSLCNIPVMVLENNYLEYYTHIRATPQERLGQFWLLMPIMLGIIVFFVTNCYMLSIRDATKDVEMLDEASEIEYFHGIKDMLPFQRKNSDEIIIPWGPLFVMSVIVLIAILFMMKPYNGHHTLLIFMNQLLVLSLLIAGFLSIWWYGISTYWVLNKIMKTKKEKLT